MPCAVIGFRAGGNDLRDLQLAAMVDGAPRYVGSVELGIRRGRELLQRLNAIRITEARRAVLSARGWRRISLVRSASVAGDRAVFGETRFFSDGKTFPVPPTSCPESRIEACGDDFFAIIPLSMGLTLLCWSSAVIKGAVGKTQEAAERARAIARERARTGVKNGVTPVPCPNCGWYQTEMKSLMRTQSYGGIVVAALLAFVAFGVMIVVACVTFVVESPLPSWYPQLWIGVLCVGLGFVGLALAAGWLRSRYNPNATDNEKRKRLGQTNAVLRTEVDKLAPTDQKARLAKLAEDSLQRELLAHNFPV
jgi:hypothetical protein